MNCKQPLGAVYNSTLRSTYQQAQAERQPMLEIRWCPKMYADKRRANKKQRRHGIFEVWKLKIPFAVPVAGGRI